MKLIYKLFKRIKVYQIYQRFYSYDHYHDRLLLETKDKTIANEMTDNLTVRGIGTGGRLNYKGIIKTVRRKEYETADVESYLDF